jgi:hypothetical protein
LNCPCPHRLQESRHNRRGVGHQLAVQVVVNQGIWQKTVALLMHLIPTAILLVLLAGAWRWDWVGAGRSLLRGHQGEHALEEPRPAGNTPHDLRPLTVGELEGDPPGSPCFKECG